MKRIYDVQAIKDLIKEHDIDKFFDNTDLPFYIIQYEKGELLKKPVSGDLLQIGISGEINIYFIRDDGEKYFLSKDKNSFILGSIELMVENNVQVYAEALTDVTVIALPLDTNREALLADNKFLKKALSGMIQIIAFNMNCKAVASSLPERVINYMKFYCSDNILKGIGKTAFHLHCSDRQLQRILNDLESKGIVKKCGKGTYKLLNAI